MERVESILQCSQATAQRTRKSLTEHEIVRPDLNLEKWCIWQPKNSHKAPEVKTLEREVSLPDRTRIIVKVELLPNVKFGNPTTEDQRVFYALIVYWNEKGKPDTPVNFSLRKLLRILKKTYGIKQRNSLIRSLLRIRMTGFTWENSYYDGSTGETITELDTFNILSDLKIARTEKDGNINKEGGRFKFNDFILKNLLGRYNKPVFFDTVLSFRSEIAQLLYTRLDLILADKSHYERRTKELFFDDLYLRGEAYKNLSDRKRTLQRALKELQGKPLTTGVIAEATLQKTDDGTDYKAVFRKGKAAAKTKTAPQEPKPTAALPPALPEPTEPTPTAYQHTAKAHELVRYFHQIFHQSGENVHPHPKALNDAGALIAEHGYERVKYLIDFSHREAPKTKYAPKTFSGILQYLTEALTEYDREERRKARVSDEQAQRTYKQARESHEEAHRAAYFSYLGGKEGEIKESHHEAYRAFIEREDSERRNLNISSKPGLARMQQRVFERADQHLYRFYTFFKDHSECRVLSFWEWDTTLNPSPFHYDRSATSVDPHCN